MKIAPERPIRFRRPSLREQIDEVTLECLQDVKRRQQQHSGNSPSEALRRIEEIERRVSRARRRLANDSADLTSKTADP